MLILGQVRLITGQLCPAGLEKRFGKGLARIELPPQRLEIGRKKIPPQI